MIVLHEEVVYVLIVVSEVYVDAGNGYAILKVDVVY